MVTSRASTPAEYLCEIPADRRELVDAIRGTILDHLPAGLREEMTFGMLGYVVPLEDFPDTYNGKPLGSVALANQKQYVSVYLFGVYADDGQRRWFEDAWRATGKRLDIGRSCVRIKRLDDVPLDVLGEAVARVRPTVLIAAHERAHGQPRPSGTPRR